MAFRAPPNHLAKHVSNMLNGGLLKKEPVWLSVLQSIPPGPSIIRSQNPDVNVSAQTELERQLAPEPKTVSQHKQKHLRARPPRPRPIVYPEDRLRREFYKDHPFELARPACLVENDLGRNRTDFSQLMLPGMRPAEVDGESVIKYQLHLMAHEKMPKRKAYAKATSEFYEIRAQEEEEERRMKEEMNKALQRVTSRTQSAKALRHEEVALRKGMVVQTTF